MKRRIGALAMLALLALAVACSSTETSSTTPTSVLGVSQPPVTHAHNYLEY